MQEGESIAVKDARRQEREACALLVETALMEDEDHSALFLIAATAVLRDVAAKIRARGVE